MNNQKLIETVKQMHEQMRKDDTNDIGVLEVAYFRDQAAKEMNSGNRDAVINVIWDAYLYGLYKGQHIADQEG